MLFDIHYYTTRCVDDAFGILGISDKFADAFSSIAGIHCSIPVLFRDIPDCCHWALPCHSGIVTFLLTDGALVLILWRRRCLRIQYFDVFVIDGNAVAGGVFRYSVNVDIDI